LAHQRGGNRQRQGTSRQQDRGLRQGGEGAGAPAAVGPHDAVRRHGQVHGRLLNMPVKAFTNGRLRKADYDPASQQLDLHWDNHTVTAYKHVPQEVFRRLCSAPNPATYWEDRIAEEYPKGTPRSTGDSGQGPTLRDLF